MITFYSIRPDQKLCFFFHITPRGLTANPISPPSKIHPEPYHFSPPHCCHSVLLQQPLLSWSHSVSFKEYPEELWSNTLSLLWFSILLEREDKVLPNEDLQESICFVSCCFFDFFPTFLFLSHLAIATQLPYCSWKSYTCSHHWLPHFLGGKKGYISKAFSCHLFWAELCLPPPFHMYLRMPLYLEIGSLKR
jgi:hypothetical protein